MDSFADIHLRETLWGFWDVSVKFETSSIGQSQPFISQANALMHGIEIVQDMSDSTGLHYIYGITIKWQPDSVRSKWRYMKQGIANARVICYDKPEGFEYTYA